MPGAPTTRLAPSPTGALHLGNARTFLLTWAIARRRGWRIVLRIEDLDGPRVKPGAIERCVDTLAWLGMDWDEGPIIQSHTLEPHIDAMQSLASRGLAYPCELTRTQIEAAASAPHEPATAAKSTPGAEVVFPASLRPEVLPRSFDDPETNWRFVTPGDMVEFTDEFAGPQRIRPSATIGDFVVWTRRGQPSYQLAVVVDDARQGVTHVVRGDDLLDSAARQLLLQRALGVAPPPSYMHLPLVLGPDGRRLAKRHGDTRVDHYRERGVPAERLVGLLGAWCGMEAGARRPRTAMEFMEGVDLDALPRAPIRFGPEDDRWLTTA